MLQGGGSDEAVMCWKRGGDRQREGSRPGRLTHNEAMFDGKGGYDCCAPPWDAPSGVSPLPYVMRRGG